MSATQDEISPKWLGEDRISLSLNLASLRPAAHDIVQVDVDYSATGEQGIRLPLELTITGPSAQSFQRRYFRRTAPTSISFVPIEGGTHLVRLRELGHNRWVGLLTVEISGKQLNQ